MILHHLPSFLMKDCIMGICLLDLAMELAQKIIPCRILEGPICSLMELWLQDFGKNQVQEMIPPRVTECLMINCSMDFWLLDL
jgi:hypothetical protein